MWEWARENEERETKQKRDLEKRETAYKKWETIWERDRDRDRDREKKVKEIERENEILSSENGQNLGLEHHNEISEEMVSV